MGTAVALTLIAIEILMYYYKLPFSFSLAFPFSLLSLSPVHRLHLCTLCRANFQSRQHSLSDPAGFLPRGRPSQLLNNERVVRNIKNKS